MDRRGLPVLIVLALLASDCILPYRQDLPVELELDMRLTPAEDERVRRAVDEWNERTRFRLAECGPPFVIVGYHSDEFNIEDQQDGIHRVYRIGEKTPEVEELDRTLGEGWSYVEGHGTLEDVMLMAFRGEEHAELMRYDQVGPEYLDWLQNIALHELGHMLGLLHFEHRRGVMNSETEVGDWNGLQTLSDADLDSFCEIYLCW